MRCSGGGDNSVVPEDEVCDPRIKPADTRTCHGDSGCGGAWFHGPWQPVSLSNIEISMYSITFERQCFSVRISARMMVKCTRNDVLCACSLYEVSFEQYLTLGARVKKNHRYEERVHIKRVVPRGFSQTGLR